MTHDRTRLPDRILTADDGAQSEYWFGAGPAGRRRYARVAVEDGEVTLLRREAETDDALTCACATIDEARRMAAEWTPP